MFRFAKNNEVEWPVKVKVPLDGGNTEEKTFTARLRLLSEDDMAELDASRDVASQHDKMSRFIVGWADIEDEHGEPLPYSPDNARALFTQPNVAAAIKRALIEASTGGPRKN